MVLVAAAMFSFVFGRSSPAKSSQSAQLSNFVKLTLGPKWTALKLDATSLETIRNDAFFSIPIRFARAL